MKLLSPIKIIPAVVVRWLRGGQQADLHSFLLTPFGHGTRMCAGRRFAEQDLYVVLARIIARSPAPPFNMKIDFKRLKLILF